MGVGPVSHRRNAQPGLGATLRWRMQEHTQRLNGGCPAPRPESRAESVSQAGSGEGSVPPTPTVCWSPCLWSGADRRAGRLHSWPTKVRRWPSVLPKSEPRPLLCQISGPPLPPEFTLPAVPTTLEKTSEHRWQAASAPSGGSGDGRASGRAHAAAARQAGDIRPKFVDAGTSLAEIVRLPSDTPVEILSQEEFR